MNKWFYFNLLLILFVLYKVIFGSHLLVSFIGGLGLLFVLFNWTRHAMFSTIRSDIPRIKKIKYAKLSKRVLPIHKWTGMSAFIRSEERRVGKECSSWMYTCSVIKD